MLWSSLKKLIARSSISFYIAINSRNPTEAADAPTTEVSYDVPSSGGGTTPQPLTYDANGNTLSDGVRSYQWDGEDRLIRVTMIESGHVTEFAYDGMDRMIRQIEKDGEVVKSHRVNIWLGNVVVESRDESGTYPLKRYHGHGEEHWKEDSSEWVSRYYTSDHLGSIRETVDEQQKVLARFEYSPYGKMQQLEGGVDELPEYGYAMLRNHAASGLSLAVYRCYDSSNARWINRDPIKENGGINVYGYVGNSPIVQLDLLGLAGAFFVHFDGQMITVPGTGGLKLPLGHAGVVIFDDNGCTKYYEFGRYGGTPGLVRAPISIPNLDIGPGGLPTPSSVYNMIYGSKGLSQQLHGGGHISFTYYHGGDHEARTRRAAELMKSPPVWQPGYTCKNFARDVAMSGYSDWMISASCGVSALSTPGVLLWQLVGLY